MSDLNKGCNFSVKTVPSTEKQWPDELLNLPIDILHLGQKSIRLKECGIKRVNDLRPERWSKDNPGNIKNIGPSTCKNIGEALAALYSSWDKGTGFNLVQYLENIEVPLIPHSVLPNTGFVFLRTLPDAVDQIASFLTDPDEINILNLRISRPSHEQKTLQELAELNPKQITRQRIQQKEARLLRQLADGMVWQEYDRLNMHFHPLFSRWWQLAAESFADEDEIDLQYFLDSLCKVWNVRLETLQKQIPVIVAIITGKAQTSASYKRQTKNIRLLNLPSFVKEMSIQKLRIGKHSSKALEKSGISTVNDFLKQAATLSQEQLPGAYNSVAKHLEIFSESGNQGKQDIEAKYRNRLNLEVLPGYSCTGPAHFTANFSETLSHLVQIAKPTPRSQDVLKLRVMRPVRDRLTLAESAEELDTHGPTIKREETILLRVLNDFLIERNFSKCPVWLDSSWLQYWREADRIFQNTPRDYKSFGLKLLDQWGLQRKQIGTVLPGVWAILNGYPHGKRGPYKKIPVKETKIEKMVPVKIKLAGFKRKF